jgi:hypothetical protein
MESPMSDEILIQSLCERGQEALMAMEYIRAEHLLAQAERLAWSSRQWELLSRLYMPLQETHRQIRQRCGEGKVCLDLLAKNSQDQPDPAAAVDQFAQGQLLIAGWGSIAPALQLRQYAEERQLYLETFLAAVYPSDAGRIVVIVPSKDTPLPPPRPQLAESLLASLPPDCLAIGERELPTGVADGSAKTYAVVMNLWERLHRPLLAAADAQTEPLHRMAGYRRTIEADFACELAHQRLSDTAREMARSQR